MNRKLRKGFTLVELMVVILILGILAGVIGLAVTDAMQENKVNLDGSALSKFAETVSLDVNRGTAKRGFEAASAETAAKLYVQLFIDKRIDFDTVKKLAGASGTALNEQEYKDGKWDTTENVIFTGPKTGKDLIDGFAKRTEDWGVLFCYNTHTMASKADYGCVIRMAGETNAKVWAAADMRDYANTMQTTKDFKLPQDFGYEKGDAHGKGIFMNVMPE